MVPALIFPGRGEDFLPRPGKLLSGKPKFRLIELQGGFGLTRLRRQTYFKPRIGGIAIIRRNLGGFKRLKEGSLRRAFRRLVAEGGLVSIMVNGM